MDFRVYVIIYAPVLEKEYEVLVPIDRRVHDLVSLLKKSIPELSKDYYASNEPNIYNKISGSIYDMNVIIKDSNIRTGTRLLLI